MPDNGWRSGRPISLPDLVPDEEMQTWACPTCRKWATLARTYHRLLQTALIDLAEVDVYRPIIMIIPKEIKGVVEADA